MIDHISFIASTGGVVLLSKTVMRLYLHITHIVVLLSPRARGCIPPFPPGAKMDVRTLPLNDDVIEDKRLDSNSHYHRQELLF